MMRDKVELELEQHHTLQGLLAFQGLLIHNSGECHS